MLHRLALTLQASARPKHFVSAGSSSLAGPQVAAFYSTWLNYSTVKDFAWADKYNPAAAPNRKVSQ